jgi:proline iminopeptidase
MRIVVLGTLLVIASTVGACRAGRAPSVAAPTPAIRYRDTAPDGSRDTMISVPGGRVFVRMLGANRPGVPVLAAHGGPGGTSCRYEILAPLAAERPIVFYDQLGSGRSDRPTDTTLWRFPRFVDEMQAVRSALGLDRVHLLGISWGGALVAEYLLSAPRAGVVSAVLGSPLLSTPRWIADADTLRATLPASVRAALDRHEAAGTIEHAEYRAATDSFYARFVRRRPVAPTANCRNVRGNDEIYLQMWGPTEFRSTGSLRTWTREADLPRLTMPVLLIGGEYDEARPTTLAMFARTIPRAQHVVVPDAAHAALSERPDVYLPALRQFLSAAERP